jgi:uncharacterized membrane protein
MRRLWLSILVPSVLAGFVVGGCGSDPATAPELARGPAGGVAVTGAEPSSARRDTTLDIRISGSGFDRGSRAEFAIDGVVDPRLRVNATQYSKSSLLIANVTISADAVTTAYDVIVTTAGGKKGIGSEVFLVLESYDLGTFGGQGSNAADLNEAGHVVGSARDALDRRIPFYWTQGDGKQPLPLLQGWASASAKAISDVDVVVGHADVSELAGLQTRGVQWTRSGSAWTVALLATPSLFDGASYVSDINAAGDVLGIIEDAAITRSAVAVWYGGATATPIIEFPLRTGGTQPGYSANAISDRGWIAGAVGGAAFIHQAFVWVPDESGAIASGSVVLLPRHGTGHNYANAIADDGTVVGHSAVARKGSGYDYTALRWRPRTPGLLPTTSSDYVLEVLGPGVAYDINVHGDIAGAGDPGQSLTAAWWPGGTGQSELAECCEAFAINANRWIVGNGSSGAYTRAYLWKR